MADLTVEQLDALPPGSVVRLGVGSDGEGYAVKTDPAPNGSELEWCDVRWEQWLTSVEMCDPLHVGDIELVSRPLSDEDRTEALRLADEVESLSGVVGNRVADECGDTLTTAADVLRRLVQP